MNLAYWWWLALWPAVSASQFGYSLATHETVPAVLFAALTAVSAVSLRIHSRTMERAAKFEETWTGREAGDG